MTTRHLDRPSEEATRAVWPPLPFDAWMDTYETLHMWTQIVGKVNLTLSPFLNEWWGVSLRVTARGLTTLPMPTTSGALDISFDFLDHHLRLQRSDGRAKVLALGPQSVADFYAEVMAALRALDVDVTINTTPCEVPNPIPFERDTTHAAYDAEYVQRWWRILVETEKVIERYRAPFVGKSSPAQFFWGTFDLNETRFSGAPAQPPEGADQIMRLAEDQENIAVGFWPGDDKLPEPAFYSYTYPEPPGYQSATIRPAAAHYDTKLGEMILTYEDMRNEASPADALLEFLQSTYEVGATLAHWDRARLERPVPNVGGSRPRA